MFLDNINNTWLGHWSQFNGWEVMCVTLNHRDEWTRRRTVRWPVDDGNTSRLWVILLNRLATWQKRIYHSVSHNLSRDCDVTDKRHITYLRRNCFFTFRACDEILRSNVNQLMAFTWWSIIPLCNAILHGNDARIQCRAYVFLLN